MHKSRFELLKHPRLARAVVLTWVGLWAERLWQAFWPLLSVLSIGTGALLLGVAEVLSLEALWSISVVFMVFVLAAIAWGTWRFRRPRRHVVVDRLDQALGSRPIAALLDTPAIGVNDPYSVALWEAHQARMRAQLDQARAQKPNLRLSSQDPYALRFCAALVLVIGLLFGSFWRVASVGGVLPGGQENALPVASWEGWVEPPHYTGLPALYLTDQDATALRLPHDSRITLRFYGEVGALTLAETVSGRTVDIPSASALEHAFRVVQDGELMISGPGGQSWSVSVLPDQMPTISLTGDAALATDGSFSQPFQVRDDYGVVAGYVRIELDLEAIDRDHGLGVPPDARDALELSLPMAISGDRREFAETFVDDFSKHPWANLPVSMRFWVEDAAGQTSAEAVEHGPLRARHFFDPVAAALIEQRRDLLWARENSGRVAQILRALTFEPGDILPESGAYLQLRRIIAQLERRYETSGLPVAVQEEVAEALWALALQLEEGDVGDALERMRQAQERLSQAMRNGASQEEIARLMQELREATQDYLRQLTRQAQAEQEDMETGEMGDDGIQLTQDDLQAMMDRIQELMEQGRMAEAEQALREFQQMMENMRTAQSQPGQGGEGQQAMDGLAETLREQQGLSDRAFRDLQEQFNPNAQAGESGGNEGRNGGQGRGQSHEGGESGSGGEDGERSGGSGGDGSPEALADRQEALRQELERQRNGLPLGGSEGDAARDALDRAGRAMEGAEDALRGGDYAEAIDRQSEAMDALREGMRELGEAMAEQQGGQNGQQNGQANQSGNALDPLGRSRNGQGSDMIGSETLKGDQARRRAWDLLDEIRRRAGERERSETERNYLQRLLDQF